MFTLLSIQLNGSTYFSDEHATLQAYYNENASIRKDNLVEWSVSYLESLGNRPFWRAENFKYQEFVLGTSKIILKRQKSVHNATAIENREGYICMVGITKSPLITSIGTKVVNCSSCNIGFGPLLL
jgi:hypothetical protein